jgi:hypothetical protein
MVSRGQIYLPGSNKKIKKYELKEMKDGVGRLSQAGGDVCNPLQKMQYVCPHFQLDHPAVSGNRPAGTCKSFKWLRSCPIYNNKKAKSIAILLVKNHLTSTLYFRNLTGYLFSINNQTTTS